MDDYTIKMLAQTKIDDFNAEVACWKLAREANPTQPSSAKQVIGVVMAALMTVLTAIVRK